MLQKEDINNIISYYMINITIITCYHVIYININVISEECIQSSSAFLPEANDTRIRQPPDKEAVGDLCISSVNCNPLRIAAARPSAD